MTSHDRPVYRDDYRVRLTRSRTRFYRVIVPPFSPFLLSFVWLLRLPKMRPRTSGLTGLTGLTGLMAESSTILAERPAVVVDKAPRLLVLPYHLSTVPARATSMPEFRLRRLSCRVCGRASGAGAGEVCAGEVSDDVGPGDVAVGLEATE